MLAGYGYATSSWSDYRPRYRTGSTRATGESQRPAVSVRSGANRSRFPVSCNVAPGTGCHAHEVIRRCLIVDDNEQFLAVARASLQRDGLAVVGTATTMAQALRKVDALRPDVVLVDIALGAESGFDLTRQIVERHPDLRVVLTSTRREEDFADLIEASPAAGFVGKAHLSASAVRDVMAAGER
jgi:CheY-like chemotaxis protein